MNSSGIRKAIEIPLNEVEMGNMKSSANALREIIKESFALLEKESEK